MRSDRRTFLLGCAAVTGAVGAPAVALRAAGLNVAVVEAAVPESFAFSRAPGIDTRIACLLRDPGSTMSEILAAAESGARVVGCTQEAATFVLEQLLSAAGWRIETIAQHRRIDSASVQHRSRFDAERDIAPGSARVDWPARFAALAMNRDATQRLHAGVETETVSNLEPSAYLRTWRLRRR